MKYSKFATFLASVVVVGALSLSSFTYVNAQTPQPATPPTTTGTPSTNVSTFVNAASDACSSGLALTNPVTGLPCLATKVANTVAPAVQTVTECVGTTGIGDCLVRAVATSILTFANFLLALAGVTLNYVVYYCVFKFGSLIGNSPGVLTAWGILRDIANMLLLFGFIFLGVATILSTDKYPTRKAIPRLLIFAILMNFSLFACEAIIDVSNGMSSLLYAQADPTSTQCTGPEGVNSIAGDKCSFVNYGIAGHIMESTGLASIWKNVDAKNYPTNANVSALLGLAIFATIGFIVLLAAAIMLAIRLIILTFLMIASPIGFAGMAIPFFQKFSNDWWNRVIHQSFYAPIMFLLIFISLSISDSFTSGQYSGTNGGLGNYTAGLGTLVTNPNASTMGIVLVFMLVCGFLLASIIVAHRFGAQGAQGAIGIGKKVILGGYGMAGRAAGGYVGRNTVGKFSNVAQKKYNASVASGSLRFLAGSTADDAIVNALKKGKEAKFGSNKSFQSEQEHHKARADELSKIKRFEEAKHITIADHDPNDAAAATKALTDAITAMQNSLKGLTNKQLTELVNQLKGNEAQLGLIAQSLTSERLEKLYDSDEVNDGVKEMMVTKRFEELANVAEKVKTGDTPAIREAAQKELGTRANALNSKDIGLLARSQHSDLLANDSFVGALSDDQFKEGRKSNHITEEQGRVFQATRDRILSNPANVIIKINTMGAADINKLKSDILSNTDVLNAMSGRKIALINTADIGNEEHVNTIVNYVKNNVLTNEEKKNSFKSAYAGDMRVQKRWQAHDIYPQ